MRKVIRVGINGFGRIGRTIFRILQNRKGFQVVAINDINGNIDNLAYLMKYDSIHGIFSKSVNVDGNKIVCGGQSILVLSEERIEDVPWNELGVHVVIGCTGILRNVSNAKKCLGPSVKKVVFSDSPDKVDYTFVFGVSDNDYDPERNHVIAASICDVVGLAPVLKKIDDKYGIWHGFITTLHPWLFYQNVMDGKSKSTAFADKLRTQFAIGRACPGTLIPKDTSLVPALEKVLPKLKGKLSGMSFRVPTDVVASSNAVLTIENSVETEEVKEFLLSCRQVPYLDYTEEPMISVDYKHSESSCVVDGKWIEVLDKHFLRMITWYDNEWGYSSRLVDIIQYISNYLSLE